MKIKVGKLKSIIREAAEKLTWENAVKKFPDCLNELATDGVLDDISEDDPSFSRRVKEAIQDIKKDCTVKDLSDKGIVMFDSNSDGVWCAYYDPDANGNFQWSSWTSEENAYYLVHDFANEMKKKSAHSSKLPGKEPTFQDLEDIMMHGYEDKEDLNSLKQRLVGWRGKNPLIDKIMKNVKLAADTRGMMESGEVEPGDRRFARIEGINDNAYLDAMTDFELLKKKKK